MALLPGKAGRLRVPGILTRSPAHPTVMATTCLHFSLVCTMMPAPSAAATLVLVATLHHTTPIAITHRCPRCLSRAASYSLLRLSSLRFASFTSPVTCTAQGTSVKGAPAWQLARVQPPSLQQAALVRRALCLCHLPGDLVRRL